ncbi:type VII secretion EssA family protein [Psychrobacillus vulpis]|uniref:Type VII secretion protein EssA n=1 Tax=Psychrobacillus vulpis TaxID=2325572 RepID=A0A544TV30_9BACI|nr:type VII secretion EssA family protein [Psychrobacillus vulpis]TQR21290.1 hypothetical protein FG384_03540 [Psychrobacillus vulpis]
MIIKKVLLLLSVILISWSFNVHANKDESISNLEPVIYEKLTFKKNTDYLHDVKKIEMKNTIPVKQFDIYFDGRKQLPNRSDTSYLFQTAERGEKSTVAAKTSELKLFSKEGKGEKELSGNTVNEVETASDNARTMILLAIIAVGLITLFMVFIPRLVNATETSKKQFVHNR